MAKRKKSAVIELPILTQEEVATPASLKGRAIKSVASVLKGVAIDEKSLGECIDAAAQVMSFGMGQLRRLPNVEVDAISFQIGVGANGTVGFGGTGGGVEVVANLTLTLKATSLEE